MLTIALFLASLAQTPTAESRALAFLAAEVPRWSRENRCFSCHNDGDGARALFLAVRSGEKVPDVALGATTRWLARPSGWEKNGGDGPFSDKILARIQFTSALAAAVDAGKAEKATLRLAAKRLAQDQAKDGSWPIDEPGPVGSPATYGKPLATYFARESLKSSDPTAFRDSIAQADAFLTTVEPANVDEAATVLLSVPVDSISRRRNALELLRKAESPDGGWGPFVRSPPETFDTALTLLALDRMRQEPGVADMITRGRTSLIASQSADGSWPETTRPSGGESYAQRISTSAWATMALMATRRAPAK